MPDIQFNQLEAIIVVLLHKYNPRTEGLSPIDIHKEVIEKRKLANTSQSERTAQNEGASNWMRTILKKNKNRLFITYQEPERSKFAKDNSKWSLNPEMSDDDKKFVKYVEIKSKLLEFLLNPPPNKDFHKIEEKLKPLLNSAKDILDVKKDLKQATLLTIAKDTEKIINLVEGIGSKIESLIK